MKARLLSFLQKGKLRQRALVKITQAGGGWDSLPGVLALEPTFVGLYLSPLQRRTQVVLVILESVPELLFGSAFSRLSRPQKQVKNHHQLLPRPGPPQMLHAATVTSCGQNVNGMNVPRGWRFISEIHLYFLRPPLCGTCACVSKDTWKDKSPEVTLQALDIGWNREWGPREVCAPVFQHRFLGTESLAEKAIWPCIY